MRLKSSNEKGLLDAQPGLAATTTRRNQEDATVTKVAAAAAEDARLQREMIAGLQLKVTELTTDGVQPVKTDTPNGTTFTSRRCAPRVLRTDHCKLILSRREVVSQGSNGVEERVYGYGYFDSF